jgi:RNA polymerase sigma factor (sigma-70 family)
MHSPSSAFAAPSSTACGKWIGVRDRCAAKAGGWKKPSPHFRPNSAVSRIEKLHELALRLDGLTLVGQQVNSLFDRSGTQDLIESAPSHDENPYDLCLRTEIKERLAEAIGTLSEKEQLVVSLYYREELTMKEIAKVVQLGESRVSQIHALALPKLRAALQKASFAEKDA